MSAQLFPPPRLSASIAMATYNGTKFLPAQLDSILAQTEPVDEIVITDDQSTDGTPELVAAYAARAAIPIKFHSNPERLGFTRNFARAIGLCRSELIFLSDQDDIWLPEKVAVMKEAFADPDVQLAYHNAQVIGPDEQPLYPLFDAEEHVINAVRPFHPWAASNGMTQVFRAGLRAHDDLWPRSLNHLWVEGEELFHDQWYFFLAQVLGRVAYIDRPLVRYRQHGGNTLGAATRRPRQLWRRIAAKLDHLPRTDRLSAAAAERRAELLDVLAARVGPAQAAAAGRAAALYRAFATRLRARYAVYVHDSLAARAAALVRLAAQRPYRHHPWGFSRGSALRDVVGAAFGRSPDAES